MKNPPTSVVSLKEKIAYSSVSFSHSLLSIVALTFILYYYTDVLQIPAIAVSVILLVVRTFDAGIDPFIGYYMDGRQTRFGKYRGYLFYWAVPFCVLFALLFTPPPFRGMPGIAIWCDFLYLAWSFVFSIIEDASLPLLLTITGTTKNGMGSTPSKS